ncbi:MAG TPA: zinc ribbon domain-containing protein [Pyrinomonadaceae bacterium]|nr:zinc ribbon domain-containing protein [Pyrinomonadaceae bacterium]
MFCPQCGQQQVSDEVRFCSRCGFQLNAVSSLLVTGGVEQLAAQEQVGESARRRGVRHGMLMFFVGIVLTAVLGILYESDISDRLLDVLTPLSAVILILGGFLRVVYALIFEEGKPRQKKGANVNAPAYVPPPGRLAGQDVGALPPAQSVPARAYTPPRARTAELAPPPSVTDHTTRLLKDTPEDDAR